MATANDRQHGGSHYKDLEYEHWDFVCDTHIHYLLGCATKYVSRWRSKGGLLDLKKAIHYLEKAMERQIVVHSHHRDTVNRFCDQLSAWEAKIIRTIMAGEFEQAVSQIRDRIELFT